MNLLKDNLLKDNLLNDNFKFVSIAISFLNIIKIILNQSTLAHSTCNNISCSWFEFYFRLNSTVLGWQAFCLEENNLYDLAEKTAKKVIQPSVFIVIFLKNVSSELYISIKFYKFCRLRECCDTKIIQKKKIIRTKICYMCASYLHYQDYSNVIVIKINILVIFFMKVSRCSKDWLWSCNQVLMTYKYM